MNILAFESSCDETSSAVVVREENGSFTVKSNIIASQIETHRLYGGVVPEIASRAHTEAISRITYEALEAAELSLSEVDLIAVTANPGLIGALLVGVNFAKGLAIANRIPLVPVDHIKGHIAACYLMESAPKPPFIALAVSGGHTAIYRVEDYTDYKMIGTTRDDAIGEAFDKIGRLIGMPYPAGREFDLASSQGFLKATAKDTVADAYAAFRKSEVYRCREMALPSPALPGDNLDFSFSGLKTAAINLLHRFEQSGRELDPQLLAARYTYEAVEAVARKIGLALEENRGFDLAVAGGVTANSHLRRILRLVTEKYGRKLFIPSPALCGDNAAMIAAQGYYEYKAGRTAGSDLNASALDSIEAI